MRRMAEGDDKRAPGRVTALEAAAAGTPAPKRAKGKAKPKKAS